MGDQIAKSRRAAARAAERVQHKVMLFKRAQQEAKRQKLRAAMAKKRAELAETLQQLQKEAEQARKIVKSAKKTVKKAHKHEASALKRETDANGNVAMDEVKIKTFENRVSHTAHAESKMGIKAKNAEIA